MIKLLIVQHRAILGEKQTNYDKITNLLLKSKNKNPDLIILPELWATGWYCDTYAQVAEKRENSPTLEFVKNIAKTYKSNVVGGSYVRRDDDGNIKNSCPVIDRNGNMIAEYDKMHLYSYLGDTENLNSVRGEKPVIANTDIGNLGISICYDIRFPEIYRCYAYGGADILINIASWPATRKLHWETLSRARAIENQSFMIAVSQTGEIQNNIFNLGHSAVVDPLGKTIASLGSEEGIIETEINISEMKSLRDNVKTLSDKHEKYILTEV